MFCGLRREARNYTESKVIALFEEYTQRREYLERLSLLVPYKQLEATKDKLKENHWHIDAIFFDAKPKGKVRLLVERNIVMPE